MKKNFLLKNILSSLSILGLIISFFSCEDVNDWGTDDNYNQMFSPVTFETARVGATSVDLRFSSVPNSKSFVIELSKDSLAFNTIESTIEILAENIVLDSTSTSKVYLTTVKKLDAETRYSARMKVTSDKDLPESKWVTLTFKTPGEQIIDAVSNITENSATLTWEKEADVTHLLLSGGGLTNKKITLSALDITNNRYELTDLIDNTSYAVEIYDADKKKGSKTFTTAQKISGDGKRYTMTGSENIVEFLNAIPESEVVLVIPTTAKFTTTEAWVLPSHITSLTLWGLTGEGKSEITLKEIKLDPSVVNFKIWIHNMKVSGLDASADYVMNDNPSSARTISEFKMDNCDVSSVRGVFRMRGALTVNKFDVDNCSITNIGSYGFLSIDAASVVVGGVQLKNSTIYKFNNTNVFTCKAQAASLSIENCTFYNVQGKDRYILNFDNKVANIPTSFNITNCLFTASDASISVRATNPKLENIFVYDSYKTSDYTVDTKYPLTGVEDYVGTSAKLFADPENGDFKIKDTSIGGEKQPGDPRWW